METDLGKSRETIGEEPSTASDPTVGSESERPTDAELEKNEESSSCGSSHTGSTDGSSGSDQKKRAKQMRLADCLKTLRMTDSIMESDVEDTITGFLRSGGNPEVVINSLADSYQGIRQYCELIVDWLADMEGSRESVEKSIEDSLRMLLEKRFESEIVDKNFKDAEDMDKWLPELLEHSRWRNLVYSLAELSPRSKFVMDAIKMISDAGFQHEITNVNTAAQQLEIYSRMVLAAIDTFFLNHRKGPMTEDYEKALAELSRVVCYSEHTYLFTQTLLYLIVKEEKGEAAAACAHMLHALRREAHKLNYQETYAIHIGLAEVSDDLKQAMSTMLCKKCLNLADIIRLYEQYSSPEPPAVDFIQDPVFIDMLVDALFAYEGSKVQPAHRLKYIFLLAYASCGGADGTESAVKEEFNQTRTTMEAVLDSIRSDGDFYKNIHLLLDGIAYSSIACGMLHYLEGLLLNDESNNEPETVHFVLLDEIATQQPGLHIRQFELLLILYDRQAKLTEASEVIIEKQRNIVDRFVHLLSVGFALPVVEKINKMYRDGQIDVSLARYFALDVLDIIEPPYSDEFVETFLPIISDREIFDEKTVPKTAAVDELVRHFSIGGMKWKEKIKEEAKGVVVHWWPGENLSEGEFELLERGTVTEAESSEDVQQSLQQEASMESV